MLYHALHMLQTWHTSCFHALEQSVAHPLLHSMILTVMTSRSWQLYYQDSWLCHLCALVLPSWPPYGTMLHIMVPPSHLPPCVSHTFMHTCLEHEHTHHPIHWACLSQGSIHAFAMPHCTNSLHEHLPCPLTPLPHPPSVRSTSRH